MLAAFSSADLDVSQELIVLRDRAVVLLAAFVAVHPLQDLLDRCCHGNRCAYAVRAVKRVVQVLDVQVDLEAGLVISRDHHRCLRVHDGGACKAALDRLEDELRVYACLLRHRESFRHCLDVAGDYDLVCKLCGVACADFAAADDGSAHGLKEGFELVEDLLFAAYHDGKRSVDRLGLAAGYRRVEHLNALLRQLSCDLLARHRVDGAHIDEHLSLFHVIRNAVCAEHNSFYMGGVGEHGQNDVAGLTDLFVSSLLSAAGNNVIYSRLVQVADEQVCKAALKNILCRSCPEQVPQLWEGWADKDRPHSVP